MHLYKLDGQHRPVEATNFSEWADWLMAQDKRGVEAERVVHTQVGNTLVSTVFVGIEDTVIDDTFLPRPKPRLFETRTFHEGDDMNCERYLTWEEAELGHARWVEFAKSFGVVTAR